VQAGGRRSRMLHAAQQLQSARYVNWKHVSDGFEVEDGATYSFTIFR
jgi:hypothetical protein